MHERRQRLDLAPTVAPLDTHSFPPQKQYRSPLDYIAVRDCRRRRTFPSLSLFTHIYFVVYLFLPQHRRCINTHRPPRIRSSDHRGISFPLSLLCDSLFSVPFFRPISSEAASTAIDPLSIVRFTFSRRHPDIPRSSHDQAYSRAVTRLTTVYPPPHSCSITRLVPSAALVLLSHIFPHRTHG